MIGGPPQGSRWPLVRTVIAATGLGFAALSIGFACLDHYMESYGECETPPAPGSEPVDCGTEAGVEAGSGSGSGNGSAVP